MTARAVRLRWAPPPQRPLTGPDRAFYLLGGILVPGACFRWAALNVHFWEPESKASGWRGSVGLLFNREANWGFGLLLAGSAVALGALLIDARKHGGTALVRVLILGGVIVSATYLVFGSLAEKGGPFLVFNLGALLLCGLFWRIGAATAAFVKVMLVVLGALAAVTCIVEPSSLIILYLAVALPGPAWSFAAYGAMWLRLRREPLPERGRLRRPFALWLTGYGAAFALALVEANRLFRELPEQPPAHCYVATAAARGHPGFVGSWPAGGGRVNAQLVWLKRGELALRNLAPRVHRLARRVYGRIGPPLAARLRHPVAADLAYLSLKPAEWAVRATFAVVLGARRTG